jgi:hypothetical protein
MSTIEMNIEELILEGVPVSSRDAIVGALRERLGVTLGQHSAFDWKAVDVRYLAAGATPVHSESGPEAIGMRTGQAVAAGILRCVGNR